MSNLYQVNVQQLEDIVYDASQGQIDLPAGYTGYAVVDSGAAIRSLPPIDLGFFYTNEYKSTQGPLAFTAAQAAALATYASYAHEFISFAAPSGDAVGVSDNLQNLATLTADDVSELNSLALSIAAVDTAANIDKVSVSEIETFGQDATYTATDASVVLTAAQALALVQENDTITVPSTDTVSIVDSAPDISALTPTELQEIGNLGVTSIETTGVDPINVSYYQDNLFGTQGSAPAGYTSYGISDNSGDIQGLTPDQIAAMPASGVYSITANGSLVFDAAQAIALENAHIIINVPRNDSITVVDTAANLEAMTSTQMAGLGALGISSIAASDTLPVFSLAQMNALGTAGTTYTGQADSGVAVVVTADNPDQNDGTTVITGPNGNGLTFDITWDASVASAPASFQTDIEEAFQFYADEFSNPITLYYTVGFGEAGGNALGSDDLGENYPSYDTNETYGALLQAMTANATSAAQKLAVASLPAEDPTGGDTLDINTAEEKALGINDSALIPTSASDPDDKAGFSDTDDFNYDADPGQTPADSEYDLIGTAEHELSEGMGRVSGLNTNGANGTSTSYSPMDLFRFESANDRALSAYTNPSYFSINDGATPLGYWNNYAAPTGDHGDLGDWDEYANSEYAAPSVVDSSGQNYTPDSYNDASDRGFVNTVTAVDLTLMNALGYDLASPWIILPLPSTDVELTVGQMLVDLVMNQIDAGSANPPAGDSYVVVDNLLDIQTLTPDEITAASSIGVSNVFAVATAAQALVQESLGPSPLPSGATGILYDAAANIEGLTPAQITALPTIGITEIESSDTSLSLSFDQASAAENAGISLSAPPGDNVTVALPDESKLFFDGTDANGNVELWVSGGLTYELVGVDGIIGDMVDASNITALGSNLVVFDGNDLYGNDGLWVSNGTAAGTYELTGIANADTSGLDPQGLIAVGSEVWFEGKDASGQDGLWETDGTAAGTQELVPGVSIASPPMPGAAGGEPSATTVVAYGDGIVYAGTDGGLWEATPAGATELVAPGQFLGTASGWGDVYAASNFDPAGFADVGGTLIFDGTVYVPSLVGSADFPNGIIETGITFDGTSVQASSSFASGNGEDEPGNFISYSVNIPSGMAGVLGTITPAAFFEGYSGTVEGFENYNPGLWYYEPSTGIGSQLTTGFTADPSDITSAGGVLLFSSDGDLVISTGASEIVGGAGYLELNAPYYDLEFNNGFPESYISGASPNGLDPSDITAFDGNAYFNGYDSAGDPVLFELQAESETGYIGFTLSSSPPPGSVAVAGGGYEYIAASGFELTGIPGASPNGIDPSNLTALNIPTATDVAITTAQLLGVLADPSANPLPARQGTEEYVVMDSAANIASLTPADIVSGESLGVTAIMMVSVGTIDVAQAEALEALAAIVPFYNTDAVTVPDTAGDIEPMTVAQISALASIGVTQIQVTNSSITLSAPQEAALAAASIQISVPAGDFVDIADIYYLSAAAIETMSLTQAEELAGLDYKVLVANDAPVALTVAQAAMFESLGLLVGTQQGAVTISDSAANVETLTPTDLVGLANLGISAITVTDASIYLSFAQADALENLNLPISALNGKVFVAGTAADIEALTAQQIDDLAASGVNALTGSVSENLNLSVAEAVALDSAGLSIGPPEAGLGLGVTIRDTAAHIETLTAQQISALANLSSGYLGTVAANDTSVVLSIGQAVAFAQIGFGVFAPVSDTVTIADTAANIANFNTSEATALLKAFGFGWLSIPVGGGPAITATDGPVVIGAAAAAALEGDNPSVPFGDGGTLITIVPPAGESSISIEDSAASIQLLTPAELDALSLLSVRSLTSNGSIALSVAQAEAIAANSIFLTLSAGGTATIADTAAQIKSLLDQGTNELVQVVAVDGISGITATDTSLALTVSEAEALEGVYPYFVRYITVTAPGGVVLTDTAADIESMSPQQLSALSSVGVTAVDVTDQSLTLTVAQALALYDPLPIYVPPGDTVVVADTESEIDSLTPTEISQLAAIGVTTVEVSNLTGAGPLTINGGITLSISGAVPSNETITFTGTGGTLALDDTAAMAGTIYGFSPPDTIDLTDIPFDTSGNSCAYLGTDPNGNPAIEFYDNENGDTYSLDIDPSQIFPTGETFNLTPDADGAGTDITVSELPISYNSGYFGYFDIDLDQTADGIVIGAYDTVEVVGGTVNRAMVQSGAELQGEYGTVSDTFVDNGGLLDLWSADIATGSIVFGPVVGGEGGTLQIDDGDLELTATLSGFAVGDAIDLTAVPYDPNGSSDGSGAELGTDPNNNNAQAIVVTENGQTFYLDVDPTQDFLNQTFVLSPDASDGTDIALAQAPIDTAVTIPSGQTVYGALVADGGLVDVRAAATLNYAVINSGGVVEVETGGSVGTGIDFGTEGGTLAIDGTMLLPNATLFGFAPNDTIDLRDIAYDPNGSATLEPGNDLQIIANGDTYNLQLDPAQDFSGDYFVTSPDSANPAAGTDISVACYRRGTFIRTARGQRKVENLKIGDKVTTASGATRPIKWIGRRSYGGRFIMGRKDILPVCIKAGALDENVPKRDLWISPQHAMYLDGVLIEAKDLVNGASIVQAERIAKVEYFHIELDSHDVIFAEGAPSESFIDDDSRGMFHNALEYRLLYPGAAIGPARYCAPRCEEGYQVEAARQRIAERAGLPTQGETPHSDTLRGYIDLISADCIAGWAQNPMHPEAPVCLDIYAGGRLIGQTLANSYRGDIKHAGLGSGCHSFEFTPPAGLSFAPDAVQVRRSLDGAALKLSVGAQQALRHLAPPARGASRKRAVDAPQSVRVHRRAARG